MVTQARYSSASDASPTPEKSFHRSPSAAPPSARASTPTPSSPPESPPASRSSAAWKFEKPKNHFQAQNTLDAVVESSAVLRTIAISLTKIANDIRWMGSGPRAGIGELALPEVQPGSSIMPGKVNPVIPESVIQVCAQVKGNDTAIAAAAQDSYFEINLMMPVAAYNLLQSISILAAAADNFTSQCIEGLQATDQGPKTVERGLMIGTSLAPVIGYDLAAQIAKEASKSDRTSAKSPESSPTSPKKTSPASSTPKPWSNPAPSRYFRERGVVTSLLIKNCHQLRCTWWQFE